MRISWNEWKKRSLERQEQGKVSPVDFVNPDTAYAPIDVIQKRYKICEGCEQFLKTKQCAECGCFMPLKTRLQHAKCPIGKW